MTLSHSPRETALGISKTGGRLGHIKKRAFDMADKDDISERDRIMALRLAAEAETSKGRLLAEGPGVVAMQDIQLKVKRLESQQFSQSIRQKIPLTR
jgi:thiamine biosynthesis protein ThiC